MAETLKMYEQYKKTSLETSSPGRLLLMLCEGLVSNLEKARQDVEEGKMEACHQNLVKAQSIIVELMATLNMEYEISRYLFSLYEYLHNRLIEANLHKEAAIIDEALDFSRELRDTWQQAVRMAGTLPAQSYRPAVALNITG